LSCKQWHISTLLEGTQISGAYRGGVDLPELQHTYTQYDGHNNRIH